MIERLEKLADEGDEEALELLKTEQRRRGLCPHGAHSVNPATSSNNTHFLGTVESVEFWFPTPEDCEVHSFKIVLSVEAEKCKTLWPTWVRWPMGEPSVSSWPTENDSHRCPRYFSKGTHIVVLMCDGKDYYASTLDFT